MMNALLEPAHKPTAKLLGWGNPEKFHESGTSCNAGVSSGACYSPSLLLLRWMKFIIESFELEVVLKGHLLQISCNEQVHLQLCQSAQSLFSFPAFPAVFCFSFFLSLLCFCSELQLSFTIRAKGKTYRRGDAANHPKTYRKIESILVICMQLLFSITLEEELFLLLPANHCKNSSEGIPLIPHESL